MDWVWSGSRGAESEIGVQIDSGQVVTEVSLASSKLETRLGGVALSAVDGELIMRVVTSVLGADLDDPGSSIAILGRQHPIYEADAFDEVGVEKLSKGRIVI